MQTKEFKVKYKDEGNGSIEGYASTWVRKPDAYGDIVKQGAFTRTLKEWEESGRPIPFLWAHEMNELSAFIGSAKANEDDYGLRFVAEFDATPEAQRVRELYKDGRLSKFSFAYDILEQAEITLEDGRKANELRDLTIYEISAVTVPANDTAEVISVKGGEVSVKVGKRNSKKDEDAIREAITLLQGVLEKEEDKPEANSEEEEQKASNSEKNKLLSYIKSMEANKNEP